MSVSFFTGLAFGLGLIIPIGAQNILVFSQGLALGMPRALWTVLATACCDTLLILAGALGANALLTQVPGLQAVLLAAGAVLLTYLGVKSLRAKVVHTDAAEAAITNPRQVITKAVAASLFNPHAIIDTVGILGAAIAAQSVAGRATFTMGTISASWLWFLMLAAAAAAMRHVLTPRRRVWFDRVSGVILCGFAASFAVEFVRMW
ncbi:L-lysine exporter family protein LysE/ArgO [Stackebrandtia albiflava]|uniref:L-lysine exporter family protein LysE/ArgO n=1 Tax=Stackebrandtia albiflava TaxID=406432 RepID=A0A562VGW2_9ACTN|nr:LysE family transporter [Stackebrandtia albiflava]TWJ17110.1 L-lysine exporter family protein LysE/ArgO [Stackebrandtia albiflava]